MRNSMKTLLLMRHGKSSWKYDQYSDHDRPLAKRGRTDVPRMAMLIRDEDLVPDIILSSSAKRARETTELFIDASGFDGLAYYYRSIYHGDVGDYLELIQDIDNRYEIVMIVGHNPGMEELLSNLTEFMEWLPTSSIAQVSFTFKEWKSVGNDILGTLENLWRPREIV